jgi:hypothetical protein
MKHELTGTLSLLENICSHEYTEWNVCDVTSKHKLFTEERERKICESISVTAQRIYVKFGTGVHWQYAGEFYCAEFQEAIFSIDVRTEILVFFSKMFHHKGDVIAVKCNDANFWPCTVVSIVWYIL